MARLPIPGGDDDTWGGVLNAYLDVEHNADGTQKTLAVSKGGTGGTSASSARSSLGAADDSSVVHLSGTETITGVKDFTGGVEANGNALVDTTDSRLSDDRPPAASTGDLTLASDSDSSGSGDIIFETGGTERARIAADGTGSGLLNAASHFITFSRSGILIVTTGASKFPIPTGGATITGVQATVGTAPTGSSIICDVKRNGTTLFPANPSNKPTISVGGNESIVTVPDTTSLSAGDLLSVDIDQVGSSTAGSDLVVVVLIQ